MINLFKKFKINQRGQSLVELIVAVAVINIGLFSVWSLFLVNFNAEKEAEMRARQLLANTEMRLAMADSAKKTAEQFRSARIADDLLSLYRHIKEERKHRNKNGIPTQHNH